MKTKEIGLAALQNHGVAVIVKKNICHVCLDSGRRVDIVCKTEKEAGEVKNTILYYPPVRENSGHEFNFEVEIVTQTNWIL